MIIRHETPADTPRIHALTQDAFADIEHSSHTEAAIIDALRRAGALTVSLVAVRDGEIIGHVAFSPVLMDGVDLGWSDLGPVSVAPGHQRAGVGTALIEAGLRALRERGAAGCVVLGDPDYYRRFGFTSKHALRYADVPPRNFQSMALAGGPASGEVSYHEGFKAR